MIDETHHILTQLQGVETIRKGDKSVWICCPFHVEKTPSCSITLQSSKYPIGTFYCFGCSESGSWNKLAEKMGLAKFGKKQDRYVFSKDKAEDIKKRILKQDKKESSNIKAKSQIPDWRGINGKLLKKIGATYFVENKIRFINLPLIVDNEHLADIKARFIKPSNKQIPSYVNSNDSNTKEYGLFPYHYVEKLLKTGKNWRGKKTKVRYICLVEGPRDALGMIQQGIPALAILGTYSWNKDKMKLLKILSVIYEVGIVVMMDSDEAGIKAQKTIVTDMKKAKLDFKQVKLNKWAKEYGMSKLDPMDAPKKLVKSIRSLCIP